MSRTLIGSTLIALLLVGGARPSAAQEPAGEVTVSFHLTIAPTWLASARAWPSTP